MVTQEDRNDPKHTSRVDLVPGECQAAGAHAAGAQALGDPGDLLRGLGVPDLALHRGPRLGAPEHPGAYAFGGIALVIRSFRMLSWSFRWRCRRRHSWKIASASL